MAHALRPYDALQPRPPGGLLPGAGLSLLAHAALVAAIAFGVSWQRTAQVEFSAELWSALPEVAAPKAPAPEPTPANPPPPPPPAAATPPSPSAAEIALERERAAREKAAADERAEREARLKREREAEAQKAKAAEDAALKRQRELQKQREEELARKAEEERLAKLRQETMQRMLAQAGGGTGSPTSNGSAARDAAPSKAYAGLLIRHIKSKLVMPDIERLPPTLEAVAELRATSTGTVLSRRLVKASGNTAWDNAVLRAIEAASPLPRDTDGRVPTTIEIRFRPVD